MMRCFLGIFLIIIVLALGRETGAETLQGMVKTVYDGDTVAMVGRGTGRVTVRLYGIDAPETRKPKSPGQPYGNQAKRVLMYKLLGKEITVEVQDRDQYGRVVAVIHQGGRDINAEMVSEGMAWAYRQYLAGPYASRYLRLEEQARRQHRGLWRDVNPQPPWEFRRNGERKIKRGQIF